MRKEFNLSSSQIFREIDPIPLGSASIAQVHKAYLLDGTAVAVKVKKNKLK